MKATTKPFFLASIAMSSAAMLAMSGLPPASAQGQPSALSALSAGEWTVRIRGGETRKICVRNARELAKLRHTRSRCTTKVLRDDGKTATVRYTCPGNGYGETTITRESGRLAQIRSQGLEDGMPFDFSAEARRIGDC